MAKEILKEDKLLQNVYEKHIKTYSDFIKLSFKDLVTLTKNDKEVFLDLYYNRDTEFNEMKSILKNIRNRGDNILILGSAGSGKSSFIYKVFYEIENLTSYKLYSIIVDYRNAIDKNHLLKNFIDDMSEYFDEMECPVNKLLDNTEANITHNIHLLKSHLADIKDGELKKHLIILLDDFDYIEQDYLFDVLEIFMGFGIHHNATLILSARPNLYASINEYDNRLAKNFTRDVHKIELARLDIKKLIAKRLAIILLENKKKLGLTKWWERITGKESPYTAFLEKMGITNLEEVEKIPIPFTDLYVNFIRCITDHNIREIFEIVHDSLIFILSNYDTLETEIEKDEFEMVEKKVIPIENALEMFFDNKNAGFQIIDLHKSRSAKGNSLFFNVLEGVRCFGEINDTLLQMLAKLGHTKKDVDWAINKLKDPTFALITASKIIPSHKKQRVDRYPEYTITKKGDYYLTNLAYWEEYQKRCKSFGHSLETLLNS